MAEAARLISSPALNRLDQPLTALRGVGPRRAEMLARLGIACVGDLLEHFPRRYEDRRRCLPIAELTVGEQATVVGSVVRASHGGSWRARRFRISLEDATGRLDAVWLNGTWRGLAEKLQPGARLALYGKIEAGHAKTPAKSRSTSQRTTEAPTLIHPEVEVLDGDDASPMLGLVPIYPTVAGLSQKTLRGLVRQALETCAALRREPLPVAVRKTYALPPVEKALWAVHAPEVNDADDAADEAWRPAALRRFLIEELLLLEVGVCLRRREREAALGVALPASTRLASDLRARLPYRLTRAQRRVLAEIEADLATARPMHRLLQGEVGSGKTVVAALAMLTAIEQGCQAAFLAPTEVLATQHAEQLDAWLAPLGVPFGLLTGSMPIRARRTLLRELAGGACKLLVGTHALLEESVAFNRLGLVVIDEQQRFGVAQRARLAGKGDRGRRPNVLVMTATPIPRSLALTIYGDLDVSSIDRLPPGRKPVTTKVLSCGAQAKAWLRVHREVARGRQAYVVCPMIEGEGKGDRKAARHLVEHLRNQVFRDLRVGLLHGEQTSGEKLQTLREFQRGGVQVLVSTSVVEVGLDVANASVMVIVNADRFGLAQLHQLRGRVGRGGARGMCLALESEEVSEEGKQRLDIFAACRDGFEIAERDLAMRGPGELLGERQAGLPSLRLADLQRHDDLARQLRRHAEALLQDDPSLAQPRHADLRAALRRLWGERLAAVGSG